MSRSATNPLDRVLAATSVSTRRRFIAVAGLSIPAVLAAPTLAQRVLAQSATPESTESSAGTVTTDNGTFFDPSVVHQVTVTIDQDAYDAMIASYSSTGDKEWVEATVVINGETFEQAGMRLKGNSTLMGLRNGGSGRQGGMTQNATQAQATTDGTPAATTDQTTTTTGGQNRTQGGGGGGMSSISADEPQGLPWLVKLDEFVTDQEYQGLSQFVIRSSNSVTALNEAVALGLLMEAGLASQLAAYVSFSVNGSDSVLRLAIENPKKKWMKAHFSGDGLLFKSEAEGDWSYRGDDPASYTDVFDLEAGDWGSDEKNFAPLTSFLDFINNSEDADFASDLPDRLDVEKFAIYLAMMDLIRNSDDIDGPGNNSYLYTAPDTDQMTVVPWDMNLALSGGGGFGGGGMTMTGDTQRQGGGTGQMPTMSGTPGAGTMGQMPTMSGTPVAGDGTTQTTTTTGRQGGNGGNGGGMQGGFGGRSIPWCSGSTPMPISQPWSATRRPR
ncbi:MAG: CotH kinase family protein [Thermomicrobiales bacterium]